MSEDRNFRYFYYEKVGFRGVEERKSLDILLAERPGDLLSKLSSFAHRFQLPRDHRRLLWKLLLDVLADPHSDTADPFVTLQQSQHCDDLNRALQLMLYTDDNTHPSNQFVHMFLLEFGELDISLNIHKQFQKNEVKDLMAISDVLVKEFYDEKNIPPNQVIDEKTRFDETYWLFRNLVSSVRCNFFVLIDTYEKFINCLAQEDKSLHNHLVKNGIIRVQPNLIAVNTGIQAKRDYKKYNISSYRPFITWFVRFYAGIIDHYSLIKLYDRIVGALIHGTRPFVVLSLVGKAILSQFRTDLLDLNTCEDITKRLLLPLTLEQSEQVINKALSA